MKKIILILIAITMCLSSVSLAEKPDGKPYRFTSFSEAVDSAGKFVSVGGDIDYLATVMEKDETFLRMVTLLDDRARELYMAAIYGEDTDGEAIEAFNAYAWSLPVSYTEEITAKPKEQTELDALTGKTVGEIVKGGYVFYGSGGAINRPTLVDLSYGLFNYTFEADATFEEYQEYEGRDDLGSLKVKSGKFSGFSSIATNLDYLADGTYEPQVVPHITAEEAAAVQPVPPAEEYTAKAWPLTAETYADLLKNAETRYSQVYAVKGVVHQVLFHSPVTVIINTGDNGKTQPVIIECPEQNGISLEAGTRCRIYADVSSACYILPVLTARYIYFDNTTEQP